MEKYSFDSMHAMVHQQNENRAHFSTREQRLPDFYKFVRHYKINYTFANRLLLLDGYEIVFICDDSGSMNTPLNDVAGPFPYNKIPTRWDELKQTVSIVVDLASTLDPNGIDVYFLNRPPVFNVRSSSELQSTFEKQPEGSTPIARVFREILNNKQREIRERNLLILIATDGVPTDEHGHHRVREFKNILLNERHPIQKIPVTIIACTDDEYDMEYLNDWDKKIEHLDVVDDYQSEKKQVLECQGNDFPFSFGDYIVKIMLGGIDPWFDNLDEQKVSLDYLNESTVPKYIR